MTDYREYKLSRQERLSFYLASVPVLAGIGLLFYRSIVMALLTALAAVPLERYWTQILKKRRLERLSDAFRDVLYSVSSSIAAGHQLPDALKEAARVLEAADGPDSDMAAELHRITGLYAEQHREIDALLADLGERSGLEEIRRFAGSCATCRKCGGDMEKVSMKSAGLLLDKLRFEREQRVLMAQKKGDILILAAMPPAILLFLNCSSYSYLAPLYETGAGRLIMTLCLLTVGAAILWSLKIAEIEI